jgi:hypothetical protein
MGVAQGLGSVERRIVSAPSFCHKDISHLGFLLRSLSRNELRVGDL